MLNFLKLSAAPFTGNRFLLLIALFCFSLEPTAGNASSDSEDSTTDEEATPLRGRKADSDSEDSTTDEEATPLRGRKADSTTHEEVFTERSTKKTVERPPLGGQLPDPDFKKKLEEIQKEYPQGGRLTEEHTELLLKLSGKTRDNFRRYLAKRGLSLAPTKKGPPLGGQLPDPDFKKKLEEIQKEYPRGGRLTAEHTELLLKLSGKTRDNFRRYLAKRRLSLAPTKKRPPLGGQLLSPEFEEKLKEIQKEYPRGGSLTEPYSELLLKLSGKTRNYLRRYLANRGLYLFTERSTKKTVERPPSGGQLPDPAFEEELKEILGRYHQGERLTEPHSELLLKLSGKTRSNFRSYLRNKGLYLFTKHPVQQTPPQDKEEIGNILSKYKAEDFVSSEDCSACIEILSRTHPNKKRHGPAELLREGYIYPRNLNLHLENAGAAESSDFSSSASTATSPDPMQDEEQPSVPARQKRSSEGEQPPPKKVAVTSSSTPLDRILEKYAPGSTMSGPDILSAIKACGSATWNEGYLILENAARQKSIYLP